MRTHNCRYAKRLTMLSLVALTACGVGPEAKLSTGATGESGDDLTGVTSVERPISFKSYVYVPVGSSDADIAKAVARQVKTGLGSLRATKISFNDRGAQSNLDPAKWTQQELTVIDPANPTAPVRTVWKVTFPYNDRAVVTNGLASKSTVMFTLLADDYTQHAEPLKQSCSDDVTTDTDSLWYHFYPQGSACQAKIRAELDLLAVEQKKVGSAPDKVGMREVARWFMPITAQLGPAKLPAEKFSPEYDRLYGNADKSQLVVYAFLGVDGYAPQDTYNPDDLLALEAMKFFRTVLRAQPNFRPVHTAPFAMLLDLEVDGKKLQGVTYDQMLTWIIDRRGYPAEVANDPAKILALRKQAISKFAERWIYWDLPIQVTTADGSTKQMTVQLRSFYGQEDGTPQARQHAQWRYLEAFWYGDIFLYNGHSHFGHGPLEPTMYGPWNFNDRYQVMLVNSCISFNYYHQDFLTMKPGGSKNLDLMTNGLPSYVNDGGVASARFLTGLIDGKQSSYSDIINGMRLDFSWGERGYDPMRVVDGELDNQFSQAKTPLTVKVLAPVY